MTVSVSKQCAAFRADGQACQAWARRGSDPPRCAAHERSMALVVHQRPIPAGETLSGSRRGDFYEGRYSKEELADLITQEAAGDLKDELSAARVALRRVLDHLEEELSAPEYALLAQVIFGGTKSIMRLLLAQQELEGDLSDEFLLIIHQALDEMGKNVESDL